METTYFILGMVSVLVIGGIVGIFLMVNRLQEKVGKIERGYTDFPRDLHEVSRSLMDEVSALQRRVDTTENDLTRYIDSRYDKLVNEVNKTNKKAV